MKSWIIDPFKFNVDKLSDDESYKEDFNNLKKSRNIKTEFQFSQNSPNPYGFGNFLKCRTGNISKFGKNSTGSFPLLLDYLSM